MVHCREKQKLQKYQQTQSYDIIMLLCCFRILQLEDFWKASFVLNFMKSAAMYATLLIRILLRKSLRQGVDTLTNLISMVRLEQDHDEAKGENPKIYIATNWVLQ